MTSELSDMTIVRTDTAMGFIIWLLTNKTKQTMNKRQRNELRMTARYLESMLDNDDLKIEDLQTETSKAADDVEMMIDEENGKIDNLPENLMFSSRADEYQDNVDNLEEIMDELREASEDEDMEETKKSAKKAISLIYSLVD